MALIPEGRYTARAVESEFGITEKGTEYIAVSFRLEDAPYAGQVRTWYGYLTEKAEKRTLESLRYCGWSGVSILDLMDFTKNFVQVTIEHQTNEQSHKTFDRISFVNRLGGLNIKNKLDSAKRNMLDARLRGLAASIPSSLAVGSEAKPINEAPPHSDSDAPSPDEEDLPF